MAEAAQSGGPDPSEIANAWAVLHEADLTASSDELALLATFEAMRLMLVSGRDDYRQRGRDGLHALLGMMLASLREHDPAEVERLTESWRPQAEQFGLEW